MIVVAGKRVEQQEKQALVIDITKVIDMALVMSVSDLFPRWHQFNAWNRR
ncbi:MAG: hypothetical protein ACLP9L_01915 [Thermoguttaceae bacterium]